MVQAQRRLDEAGHPGSSVEVADVALDRPDGAVAGAGRAAGAKRLSQARDLDGIAEWRGGSVGLDVGDRLRVDPSKRLRQRDDVGVPVDARRREAHLRGAVVVHAGTLDDGVDRVTVGERVAQVASGPRCPRRC